MEKKAMIPQLRFPEFEGKWEKKKLGEISENIMYGMNAAATSYDGENKYIRITDIDENSRTFNPNPLSSPDGIIEDKYKLKVGDIVFARTGASVGKTYLYNDADGNLYFAGFLIKFSIINNNPYFIFVQTLRNSYEKWVQLMSMRSGQPGINAEEYKILTFSLPTLPEQQKIASFLISVDERLQALRKKRTLLEQYKKGVMQKIFSQVIRFKSDGVGSYPDWEEKRLGEITYKVGDRNKEAIQYPIYSINNKDGFIPQSDQFEGMDSNDRGYDISLYKIVNNNTFAYNPARINVGSIGYSGSLNSVIISSLYVCFKTNYGINDFFLNHFFSTNAFNKSVLRGVEGGVREYLFYENFCRIRINIPCYEEQTKIANFLSAIDDKLSGVAKEIEATEKWKKGLLQRMFC